MNQVYKNLALWMVIGLIVILLFTVFQGAQQGGQEQPNFSAFLRAVDQCRVDSVVIRGIHVTYTLKDSAQPKRTYPSSLSLGPISWRCLLASGLRGSGTSLSRARSTHLVSSSWTRSTPSDGTAARAWAAVTTSASRRSTSSSSRWTASRRTRASSSSPRRTGPTCSTRRCSARGAST